MALAPSQPSFFHLTLMLTVLMLVLIVPNHEPNHSIHADQIPQAQSHRKLRNLRHRFPFAFHLIHPVIVKSVILEKLALDFQVNEAQVNKGSLSSIYFSCCILLFSIYKVTDLYPLTGNCKTARDITK